MRLREKTTATLLIAILMISTMAAVSAIAKKDYATIKDGTITYGRVGDPSTEIIPIGVDRWGYNYQAHIFNGWLENYGRPDEPVAEGEIHLVMKWSDIWLSNKDRNLDTKLDRGTTSDYDSSASEGAWLTNHQSGVYEDGTHWYYFVKIVHPGYDADYDDVNENNKADDGEMWSLDGVDIGPSIWGAYAIIQEFENNVGHTVIYKSPSPVGFGYYKPVELQIYNPSVRSNVCYNTDNPETHYRLIFSVCVKGVEDYADIDYVKVIYPDETELLLRDEGDGWGYHEADDGEYFEVVDVDEQITGDFTFEVADNEGNKAQITANLDEWLPTLDWVSPGSWAELTGNEVIFNWQITVEEPTKIDYYEFRLGTEYDGNVFLRTWITEPTITYSELPYESYYGTYFWWVLAESEKGNSVHAVTKFTLTE